MASARILVLTTSPLCRNPRVLKEAITLGTAGFDVTVATVANTFRFETYDDEIMRTAPFRKVTVDHLGRDGRGRRRALASRLGTWLARRAVRFGLQPAQALGPVRALARIARAVPSDLAIAHTETALVIALRLAKLGRRVAADFEDWHSCDLLPEARRGRPLRLIRRVESELMRRSAYVSTTSHAMAEALQAAFGGARPIVITNSFPLQADPARGPRPGPPAFFWFSQTVGPGRGLEAFIAAWGQTRRPSRLCLLGDIDPRYGQHLAAMAPPERRSRLQFLPVASPAELPSIIARHDIGLALEPNAPANKNYTISNKLLQYFNAGLAVLASDTAGQREVFARAPESGIILRLDDPAALGRALDEFLSDPARLARMGAAARRAAEEIYCWEREAPGLITAVENALAAPRP